MICRDSKSFYQFLILWIGEFISSIGSGLSSFALGVYLFKTTRSVSAVSITTLFAFLPTILLNPLGGVLTDRFDRRLMMIFGDSFSALGLIFMLLCLKAGSLQPWQIYIGVSISAIFIALLEPAYKATITDMLSREDYVKANGMIQLAASSKYLISPFIGGFLLTVTSIDVILIIDISTFAVTVLAVALIRKLLPRSKKQPKKLRLLQNMKEGWRAITGNRGVLMIIALISVATFYLGFLQILISPMLLSFTSTEVLGSIESLSAIGMLVGSIIIGIIHIKSYVRTLSVGFCLAGVFITLLGVSTNLLIITISGFLFFSALPFINSSADVMIRCRIPNELQGRAWGLISILSQLGYVLAYALSGLMADYIFNPMFLDKGLLYNTIGKLIGTGPGRGIGFMLILSGIFVIILGALIKKLKLIREMEPEVQSQ